MWTSNALISYLGWTMALSGYGKAAVGFVHFMAAFEE